MKYVFISDGNYTITDILYRYLPLNKEKTKKLLDAGEVKVNGIKVHKGYNVDVGAEVSVFVPTSFGITRPSAVYVDENILILDKPIGYEVETSLKTLCELEYGNLFAVHRLDRNTTGLTIFARNEVAANDLKAAIKKRLIKKFYLVWLKGEIKDDEKEMVDYLRKTNNGVKIYSEQVKDSLKIITRYRVLKRLNGKTLAEVELVTGRTHQIRAHFAYRGFPVEGDSRYGNGNGYQKLRAYKIIFDGLETLKYLNGKTFEAESETFCRNDIDN